MAGPLQPFQGGIGLSVELGQSRARRDDLRLLLLGPRVESGRHVRVSHCAAAPPGTRVFASDEYRVAITWFEVCSVDSVRKVRG